MRDGQENPDDSDPESLRIPVGTTLAEAERRMILATLRKCGGNKTRAAALLGVSLKTLYNRLNAYRGQGASTGSVLADSYGGTKGDVRRKRDRDSGDLPRPAHADPCADRG